jgi:hypothetical protein
VLVRTRPDFNLDETIFQTLPTGVKGFLPRTVVSHRLGVDLFWDDGVAVKIQSAFAKLQRPPKHDQRILEFMQNRCNFNTEHADGMSHHVTPIDSLPPIDKDCWQWVVACFLTSSILNGIT